MSQTPDEGSAGQPQQRERPGRVGFAVFPVRADDSVGVARSAHTGHTALLPKECLQARWMRRQGEGRCRTQMRRETLSG